MACRSKSHPDPNRRRGADATRWPRRLGLAFGLALFASGCASIGPSWHPLAHPVESLSIVGAMQRHTIRGQETLLDLTRPYDLGYVELLAANPGIDPWIPGEGREILLPTAHLVPAGATEGIVINLAEQRLYVFAAGSQAPPISFPIGVSREGWTTPLGTTRVVRKRAAPIWYPTESARREDPSLPTAVAAGPENPLGEFALYLEWPRYLIHGTNEPDGVGRRVSRGCIRLYPEDIARLFEMTPVETPVRVVHQPVKLAREGDDVYLEVHPTLDEMAQIEEKARLDEARPEDLRPQILAVAGELSERIDWRLAYRTAAERRGVPVRITTP